MTLQLIRSDTFWEDSYDRASNIVRKLFVILWYNGKEKLRSQEQQYKDSVELLLSIWNELYHGREILRKSWILQQEILDFCKEVEI